MKNNVIAFYISSHGFGHMTRCLAIMEEILGTSNITVYVVCGKKQNDFAKLYLRKYVRSHRMIFNDVVTDIGLINKKDSLNIDTDDLNYKLYKFLGSWNDIVCREYQYLKLFNVKCVISDISPLGPLVSERLGVPSIGISNFTWIQLYEFLQINKDIIDNFNEAYSKLNSFIEYHLALPMIHKNGNVNQVGLTSRKLNQQHILKIRRDYGNSIFITCGRSANLQNIKILNYDGNIFATSGTNIKMGGKIVHLPIKTLDTQNYIAASDLIITKAGWGTIAEALIAGRKLVLLERPSVFEDTYIINFLKKENLAISISESDLENLNIYDLMKEINHKVDHEKLNSFTNDVSMIIKLLPL
jgi:uncharacterized protein (TIGR00661 family)